MRHKKILAGVLAAVMAAGSSFVVLADTTTGGLESAVEVTTGESQTQQAGEGAPAAVTEAAQEAPTAAVVEATAPTAETTTAAPTAAVESSTVTAGSSTVTAGSSTVTAGSSSSSGAPAVSVGSSSGTATSGSSSGTVSAGGSRVVGAGTSSSGGPGMSSSGTIPSGVTVQTADLGNVSFAGTISSPIVQAADKYSYDQMTKDIQSLSSRYGNLMHTNVIGTSNDGRKLYEIVLGNQNAPKHILIHAGIHAREYMTPLLVMKQLEHGLYFYNSSSYEGVQLSNLFNQVAIHFVPMVNPDGISISQFGISAIRSEQLRQTINQCYAFDVAAGRTSAAFDRYLNYWKANGRGVDLNQNFPADWDQVTSCGQPSYATYKGPSPASEPESQALVNLVNSRTWALTISYHSMGNIIYWDYQGNRVSAESQALAALVASKTGYRLAGSSGHGGFKDWVQIKDGPIPSLTIEVGSVSCPMPLSEFAAVWNQNHQVWVAAAKYAMEH